MPLIEEELINHEAACMKGVTHPYPKSPGEEAMTYGEPRYGTCPVGQLLEAERSDEL